ncbi:hypothetical protein [Neisseria sicca]|uniref:hypothetical protein n=2 Tax=Neisseria sicca TaxID=490 RepID=UPI00361DE38A
MQMKEGRLKTGNRFQTTFFILQSKSAVKIRKTHDYLVKYVFTTSAIFMKKMGGATNESENSSWTATLASRMFKVYLDVYLQ